jgi:glycosyltransferase involved in cell wall biosynthesis
MMAPTPRSLVCFSLFDVPVPSAGIDAFLDNDDAFWWAFDRYGVEKGYRTAQVYSVRQGILPAPEIRRIKGSTEFVFLSRPSAQVVRRLPDLIRNADLVLFNNESRLSLLAGIAAKATGRRVMAFYHNELETGLPLHWRMLLRPYRTWALDAAFTTTEPLKQSLLPVLGCPVYLFPFGVDTAKFSPVPRVSGPQLQVLYCGRISPEKRIEDIIDGIGRSAIKNRITLTLAGEDYSPDRVYLKSLIAACERLSVTYKLLGYVSHAQLPGVYAGADLLVNMRPDEGFGKVFVEAMASGLPVIGRRGALGVTRLIRDGVNGCIVDTSEELAAALARLAELPELRAEMGKRGVAFVAQELSLETSYAALSTCLHSLVPGKIL